MNFDLDMLTSAQIVCLRQYEGHSASEIIEGDRNAEYLISIGLLSSVKAWGDTHTRVSITPAGLTALHKFDEKLQNEKDRTEREEKRDQILRAEAKNQFRISSAIAIAGVVLAIIALILS